MISVVLSSYNGENYITEQLDSILAQTYKEIEIIVVDDCSTDSTLQILKKYEVKHSNIRIFEGETNLGYIKNFERGLQLAKGDFTAFSDQDDYWQPQKLEKLINHLNDYDVIYCDSEKVDVNLKPLVQKMSTNSNCISSKNPLNFTVKNCVSGHAMIFKRNLLDEEFELPKLIPHDWYITFLASCRNGVLFFNEPLVKYRIHETNMIAGSGHSKVSKEDKNKARKYRLEVFSNYAQQIANPHASIIKRISESYKSNSIFNRVKRVFVFVINVKPLFRISNRNYLKKYFYAFSMFFKIR